MWLLITCRSCVSRHGVWLLITCRSCVSRHGGQLDGEHDGGRDQPGRDQGVRAAVQDPAAVARPHPDAGGAGAERDRGPRLQPVGHLQVHHPALPSWGQRFSSSNTILRGKSLQFLSHNFLIFVEKIQITKLNWVNHFLCFVSFNG